MARPKQARWQNDPSLGGLVSGRSHLINSDKVFDRVQSLDRPRKGDTLPIYQIDDLPKDLFFPVTEDDVVEVLAKLPKSDTAGLTHIWLRRPKASEFRNGRIPLAEYVSVESINLIAIYPWPANMLIPLPKKPIDSVLVRYRRWTPELVSHKAKWSLKWRPENVQDFFQHDLLQHEIGLHAAHQRKLAAQAARANRIELPNQYANQRFIEGNYTIY